MPKRPVVPALERVHRCRYCGREHRQGSLARRENPLCERCLHDRIAEAAQEHSPSAWVLSGGYLIPVRER